ncbi:AAA family ATPase [Polymorphospora sp. NPDC051019]|uniref:uridine kinase family protein n=1 Tax=Polymorphospora sp. NPDC051019 TaxID=3155725 RepID=UPI003422977E
MISMVLGLSGPSGSGKSTLANEIHRRLTDSVILQQDWYFINSADCPPDANFCDPKWLDIDLFVTNLRHLKKGSPAAVPAVDFASFARVGTLTLQPAPLIIVEGMTIFRIAEIADCFDLRYYLDTSFDVLAERKRARDKSERLKPAAVIEAQLQWLADEHRQDAELRARPDVVLRSGETPVGELADEILEAVTQWIRHDPQPPC